MAIGNFNNNESLSSVRTKLNSTIDVANELAVVEQIISTTSNISADTTLAIITSQSITVTLPDISTVTTKLIKVKNLSNGQITLDCFSGDAIEDDSNGIIMEAKDCYHLYPYTTSPPNWIIV